jgi:opacity protein-like surface antigen
MMRALRAVGLIRAVVSACALAAAPSVASADVLLTPFAGLTFVDDAGKGKATFGATLGVGSLIGLELDVSQTRLGTFDDIPIVQLEATATTVMGNLVIRVPAGPIQPYVSGGAGLIRIKGDVNVPFLGDIISASAQDLGGNVGGGLHIFPTPNVGIRADARYFRTLGDLAWDEIRDLDGLDDLPLPRVDFWRLTGGVTIKF